MHSKQTYLTAELGVMPQTASQPDDGRKRRLWAVTRNTFRETVRDRVLYNLVLFALLLTGGAIFLGELSSDQEAKIIVDMGLSAMLLFGTFIALFVGVGLVYKEIEKRTLYIILAKPVGRGEFLLGKYLGLAATLLVNVAVMGLGVSLALLTVKRSFDPLLWQIWPAIALIYAELLVITAIAFLFSAFSTPALSALLTFFAFIIGHFSADLKAFAATQSTAFGKLLFTGLFYVLPNLAHFSYITPAAYGQTPSVSAFIAAWLYAVLYSSFLLGVAALIFSRRNFK